jgi:hypothetical protein
MLVRTIVSVCALVYLFGTPSHAGDDAVPAVKLKVEGETVYNCQMHVLFEPAPNMKDARSVVEAWCSVENRAWGIHSASEAKRADDMVTTALSEAEARVLAAELRRPPDSLNNEDDVLLKQVAKPKEVGVGTTAEDGVMHFEVAQVVETHIRQRGASEWKVTTEQRVWRVTCIRTEDATWRIDRVEFRDDTDWREDKNFNLVVALERELVPQAELKEPELKNDSPEATGDSFTKVLRPLANELGTRQYFKLLEAVGKALIPLFSDAHIKALRKRVAEAHEKESDAPALKIPSIERRRDETDGSVTLVYAGRVPEDPDRPVVKVKKTDGGWRVFEIGIIRDVGTEKEEYEIRKDIYEWW